MKNIKTLQTGEPASAPGQSRTNLPHRILVVDDDSGVRQLSAEALCCSGYQVETAEDGVAAWEALQASGYDLLIANYHMPRMSGIDLLKKIRSARVDLPVIMITSALPEPEFAQYPWQIPDATLLKPITVERLLGTVQEVLRALTVRGLLRPTGKRAQPAIASWFAPTMIPIPGPEPG